ncbi:MAG: Asp-tRNA(Asn)/Glu-tRNA(Gln) amidotransferase subunit GatC, partial [Deltaproteobacteria bacterium]
TQLDMEAAFVDEEFIYEVIEELTVRMFALGGITLPRPFPRMTYRESVDRYGTDCPDTRFNMTFEEVADIVQHTDYSIFRQIIAQGGKVKGFCVKGQGSRLSKNVLQNEYALKIVPSFGAKGMTWMKVIDGELESNIVQFFSPAEQEGLKERFHAEDGDVIMMIADTSVDIMNKALCSLRLHVAERLGLIPKDRYCPLWITDFPIFEMKDGRLSSQHHPFTMPYRTDFDPADTEELLRLNSRAYDLVINGEELGGGSIRIHKINIQEKIFKALGLSQDEVETKFGFFLRAMEYGAPPHGGLALGLDRVIAMILKTESIRDVIAFPKNRSALCPLTQAPSPVARSQLRELGLDSRGIVGRPVTTLRRPAQEDVTGRALAESERISKGEVKHVAKLARLRIADSEADAYQKELNAVLEHFETLQELDTEEGVPMSHVLELKNVWREDKPSKSKKTDSLLANAPMEESHYFKVPKILKG